MGTKNKTWKWTDEQKANLSKKCKESRCNNPLSKKEKQKKMEVYWTPKKKKEHSAKMAEAVKRNPDSYSKYNVSGRAKMYDVMSTSGLTKVKGTWELTVANILNEAGIKWTNDIKPYPYFFNDKWHLYFPDFYLIDYDIVVEVKGYKTDRDTAKWDSVQDKTFKVIDKDNLAGIEKGCLTWLITKRSAVSTAAPATKQCRLV